MKRIIFISLAVLAIIGLAVFKLLSNSKEAKKKIYIHDMQAAVLVDTDKPQLHTFESAFTYLGVFEPYIKIMWLLRVQVNSLTYS